MRFPEIPRTYELTRSVPDHEVLLVFNGDEDAVKFLDWLQSGGWVKFNEWRERDEELCPECGSPQAEKFSGVACSNDECDWSFCY